MDSVLATGVPARSKRRLTAAIKLSLRELILQVSLLNHQVGAHLDLKDVDLDCLNLVARYGPLSPRDIARRAGLHPATLTGILDRLEHGSWVARERGPLDRRAVAVRALHHRSAELRHLYAGMNASIEQICASYANAELELLADFLGRIANAGHSATDQFAGGPTVAART